MGGRGFGPAALALVIGGCFEPSVYPCRGPDACDAGVCEPSGFCSYVDEACTSGRRYSALAGEGLAGLCVDPTDPATTGGSESTGGGSTGSSSSSTSGSTTAQPVCGNGVMEGDEACDDGNDAPADGCSPQCVISGTPIWETVLAGDAGLDDRAWSLAILAPSDVVICGLEGTTEVTTEAFYGRLSGSDGAVQWSDTFPADDSVAEAVAVSLANELIVGGSADGSPWLRKVDGDGEVIWETRPAIARLRGIAPNVGGAMLAGSASDADGSAQAVLVGIRAEDGDEEWRQVLPAGDAFTSIARRSTNDVLLLATMGSNRALVQGGKDGVDVLAVIEALANDQAQGLGLRGDSAVIGGYVDTADGFDWWIGVYDGATQRWAQSNSFIEGVAVADEFEDVAFMPDGSVVGVGLITNDDKDIWVAVFDAEGGMTWSRVLPEDNRGDDVARAVAVAPDGSIVVAGEITVDDSRDIWIAKLVP